VRARPWQARRASALLRRAAASARLGGPSQTECSRRPPTAECRGLGPQLVEVVARVAQLLGDDDPPDAAHLQPGGGPVYHLLTRKGEPAARPGPGVKTTRPRSRADWSSPQPGLWLAAPTTTTPTHTFMPATASSNAGITAPTPTGNRKNSLSPAKALPLGCAHAHTLSHSHTHTHSQKCGGRPRRRGASPRRPAAVVPTLFRASKGRP
jgi:hypothetical protein